MSRRFPLLAALCLLSLAVHARGEDPADPQAEAQAAYDALETAYLANDWAYLAENERLIRRHTRFFTPEQRMAVDYAMKNYDDFQPTWWKGTQSVSSTKIAAETWGKKFVTQYEPGRDLGFQRVRGTVEVSVGRNGMVTERLTGIEVIVTWQPGLVDDPKPATGKLAEQMGYSRGDVGEVIVWHELGHGYLTLALPLNQLIAIYQNHGLLFGHLQEFFADLTSVYHASPRAVRAALQVRLDGLDHYDDDDPHVRGAHAIGALLVHEMLLHPDDWPSVHFPPAVPKQQAELNTIIYIYEHWDKDWSMAEAQKLREMMGTYVKREGDTTFRRKGTLNLPSQTQMKLMMAEDHTEQQSRDKWVAVMLKKHIDAGRADTLAEGETYEPRIRRESKDDDVDDEDAMRIDVPW